MRRVMCRLPLTVAMLALWVLPACCPPIDGSDEGWLFACTGEEETEKQIYGLLQLAGNTLRPRPRTAPDVPVAHTGMNPFGINVFLNQEVEPEKRERSVQMIAQAGFHWLRQEFPWQDIEIHGKGDFVDRRNDVNGDGEVDAIDAWAKYDHIVALAEKYGLEIVARLSSPPTWSRAVGEARGAFAPPDNLADWGDFVYTVVSRYRGRIRYYQLWNEPNIYPEWGEQPVDPEGYTRLLCAGYRRAKEADPQAVVISGALAPTVSLYAGPGPGTGLNDLVFLQRMYDAGAGDCFDIMAVNNYMLWSGPTDRRMQPFNINFSRPLYIRDIMVANGDAAKPIWISEMNSNAVPNDPGIQGWGAYGQVTLEQQARYAVLAYRRVMEEWPWVGAVNFWFFKRASDAERNQSWYYFRMVEPDFTPLPVYTAIKEFTASLTPTMYPGVHQEDHWALEYQGKWEHVCKSASLHVCEYRRAIEPGAAVRFWFEGASLILIPGPGAGVAEVGVDGGAPRRIALDGRPVELVSRWRRERHEVVLTTVSGEVSIDAFAVQSPWRPSFWLIVGMSGLIAAGAAVLVRRARR